jgi:hypothetical protein
MFSAAFLYRDGHRMWELVHDAREGIDNLSIDGFPPRSFESIRRVQIQKQQETPRGVDYIFDIPVEVAAGVCNYRHDQWQFEWGTPQFTRLDVR